MSPYAATKFGLRAVTDSLRVELRPWGISASILEVGDVNTPLWAKSQEVIEKAAREMPDWGMELYGPVIELKERFQPQGISPIKAAIVVEHALTARRQEARYVVGRDVKFFDLLRWTPVSICDWLISNQLLEYG